MKIDHRICDHRPLMVYGVTLYTVDPDTQKRTVAFEYSSDTQQRILLRILKVFPFRVPPSHTFAVEVDYIAIPEQVP